MKNSKLPTLKQAYDMVRAQSLPFYSTEFNLAHEKVMNFVYKRLLSEYKRKRKNG